MDQRYTKLAKILVEWSTQVKKGDRVCIMGDFGCLELAKECARLCYQKGARVSYDFSHEELAFTKFKYASEVQLKTPSAVYEFHIKHNEVFIRLRAPQNTNSLNNIDAKRIQWVATANMPAKKILLEKRWVFCDVPATGAAQDAKMSMEEYADFVFGACLQDWKKLSVKCRKLGLLLNQTKKVRIKAKGTDLWIDVTGRKASSTLRAGQGQYNIPDGEVFITPVRDKTEGQITFEWPQKRDKEVRDLCLEFKKGKVVKFSAGSNADYFQAVLETDQLSDSLGELGIGMNAGIKTFTNNILYDEKIGGTIHIALGSGYPEIGGDPNSAVHWDLVKNLKEKGELWFDDQLVQKQGKFLVKL
ncbi:aminopeptidase [Candidatus Peregrinibacteria bacterium CG08_land_8_20_14_0_20_41_10]|nr:MAG: aminopeptidase [Candidatus Peregrinibacteria bacterium CG08_land_8_20_14_0_20_41_10]